MLAFASVVVAHPVLARATPSAPVVVHPSHAAWVADTEGLLAAYRLDESPGSTDFEKPDGLGDLGDLGQGIEPGTVDGAIDEFDTAPAFTSATNLWARGQFSAPQNLSVDLWIRPTARPDTEKPAVIFDSSNESDTGPVNAQTGLLVWMDDAGLIHGAAGSGDETAAPAVGSSHVVSSAAVPLNAWTQVTFTYLETGLTRLYLDAAPVDHAAAAAAPLSWPSTASRREISIGQAPHYLGGWTTWMHPNVGFVGAIDELLLFGGDEPSAALDPFEIIAGRVPTGLPAGSPADDELGRRSTRGQAEDPVDVASGNMFDATTDLLAPDGVTPLASLTRHLNTLGGRIGQNGPGWTTTFDTRIRTGPGGDRTLYQADGESIRYVSSGSSSWTVPASYLAPLTWSAGTSRYTLRRPDGTVDQFNASGWLVARTDAAGSTVALTRDASGALSSVTAGSYALTFTDDKKVSNAGATVAGSDGYPDRAASSDGRVVRYGYGRDAVNGATVLTSASFPHTAAQDAVSPRAYGQRRYVTQNSWIDRIYEETDPGVERLVVDNTLDAQGRVTAQVSADGDTTTFHYGKRPAAFGGGYNGALAADPGSTTVDHSSSGDRTVYEYDAAGQLEKTYDAFANPVGRTWTDEKPATTAARGGVQTSATYDAAGRPKKVTETSSLGTRTSAEYTYVTAETAPGAAQDLRLATSKDAAGVVTEFVYANPGDLKPTTIEVPCDAASSAVTCPAGGTSATTLVYDATFPDLVFRQTDADGVKTEHTYWPDRSVKEVRTFPNGPATPSVTSYAYQYPPFGPGEDVRIAKIVTVTAPGSRVTVTRYDAEGRVIEVRDPLYNGSTHGAMRYEYAANGELTSATDPAGGTTTYQTLRAGQPGWPAGLPAGVTRIETTTDPDGISERTLFDRSGDAVEEWRGKLSSPAGIAKTRHTYGGLARLTTTVDPMGVKTSYGYDIEGRVTTVTTGPTGTDTGHRTTTAYDAWGNQTAETGPVEADPSSAAFQARTTSTYDAAGRVRTQIAGDLGAAGEKLMTSYVYDSAGRLFRTIEHRNGDVDPAHWQTIAAGDKVTETRYSLAGRAMKAIEPGADNPSFDWASADPKRVTTIAYDTAGRQSSVTDPRGKTTTTTYTPAGEVDTVTSPAGRVTDYGYDLLGRTTSITTPSGLPAGQPATVTRTKSYWPGGQLKTDTDPHIVTAGVTDPSTRTFHYTPGGRLDDVTDALGRHVTYAYDDRGNRSTRTSTDDTGAAVTESWTWDLNDNLKTHVVPPPHAGAAPMTTSYTYDYDAGPTSDDHGSLVTVTDPTGRVETRTHYGSGALKSRTWTKTGSPTQSSKVWLNSRGATTKMSDTTGTTSRDTTYTVDRTGQTTKATSPAGSISYTWDLAGNLRDLTQPDGSKFRYSHLPTGQLSEFLGYSTGSGTYVLISNYTYDDDGLQTNEWIYSAGGSTRTNTLNTAGKTTTLAEAMRRPDSSPMWEHYTAVLGYRPDQRLATEQVNGGTTAAMAYDAAGQLTAQSGTGAVGYTYGTRGNRLTSTAGGAATSYTTNPNGSVASATTGSTVVTYDYDDAGRRTLATTKVAGTTTRTVATAYDARGKPATVTDTAGSTVVTEARTYDGDSQLTNLTITGGDSPGTYELIWDSTVAVPRLSETRKNGSTWARSDYGNQLIALKNGFFPKWYKTDARHSILNPDNNTNNATGPTGYDPFGQPTGAKYLDTGYRSELHLGNLIHLRNRDYDPNAGQFTTPDPKDGVDGSPSVAARYPYAQGDPYDLIDPLGLRATDAGLCPVRFDDVCIDIPHVMYSAAQGAGMRVRTFKGLNGLCAGASGVLGTSFNNIYGKLDFPTAAGAAACLYDDGRTLWGTAGGGLGQGVGVGAGVSAAVSITNTNAVSALFGSSDCRDVGVGPISAELCLSTNRGVPTGVYAVAFGAVLSAPVGGTTFSATSTRTETRITRILEHPDVDSSQFSWPKLALILGASYLSDPYQVGKDAGEAAADGGEWAACKLWEIGC